MNFARLSPVQDAYQIDGRTHRIVLTHQDTAAARFSVEHVHEGIHLLGSALRGVQLSLASPRVERSCELDLPHLHRADPREHDLILAFAAKTAIPGSRLLVSFGLGVNVEALDYRRVLELDLGPSWREMRVPIEFFHPAGPTTPFQSVLFEFKPANALDSWLREPRFLAMAGAESEILDRNTNSSQ